MLLSLLFRVDADFFELHVNLSESHFKGLANDWWHLTRENWSIRVLRGACRKFGDRSLECKTKNSTSTFLCLTRNRGQSPRGGGYRAIGFFHFPAPKGQNEIAQGKAKRRPGYVGEWISAPLGSAPSGRDSVATFQPTGQTATPPEGGGFFDWIDGVDWIDCVESGQNGHCQRGQQRPPSIQSTRSIQSTLSKTQRARRRRLEKTRGQSPSDRGFYFSAPKGQNEIVQGKAKRRPGYVREWISSPLSSAPSGRDSISTLEPTGRCPGLSPCAPLGQKARNPGTVPTR